MRINVFKDFVRYIHYIILMWKLPWCETQCKTSSQRKKNLNEKVLMHSMERLPILTARSILEFIISFKSDAATKGRGWFLRYSEQIKQTNRMHKDFELIKRETSSISTLQTNWTHLNTKIFEAEVGISHKFQLMRTMLSHKDRQGISCELERLQNGILDMNSGVLSNMSVIHQVLVGTTVTNPSEKGLLEMWSTIIHDNMRINLMSARRHQDYVDKYLDNAAILQFKGILLFTEANTNYSFCSQQLDFFENNLKYQIRKNEKIVPTYMKYLTDPDKTKGFVLRPVFDGKDEPFVRSQGLNKRICYDYRCGYSEKGKWFFVKSPNFSVDGSLIISGRSNDGICNYMSVSEKNIVECVADKCRATPFNVIPLELSDNTLQIIICKSKSKPDDKPFLGNSLRFIDEDDNREFTLAFDRV